MSSRLAQHFPSVVDVECDGGVTRGVGNSHSSRRPASSCRRATCTLPSTTARDAVLLAWSWRPAWSRRQRRDRCRPNGQPAVRRVARRSTAASAPHWRRLGRAVCPAPPWSRASSRRPSDSGDVCVPDCARCRLHRIVGAQLPADRKAEQPRQQREDAIGVCRRTGADLAVQASMSAKDTAATFMRPMAGTMSTVICCR